MLPRLLLRPRLPHPPFFILSLSRNVLPSLKSPTTFPRAPLRRHFHLSPVPRQRFQYVRFNDPFPQGSGGKKGPGGGRTYWQQLWYRFTPGQKLLLVGVGGGAPLFYVTHLETVEHSGRRRFIFMSRGMEEALGKSVGP